MDPAVKEERSIGNEYVGDDTNFDFIWSSSLIAKDRISDMYSQ